MRHNWLVLCFAALIGCSGPSSGGPGNPNPPNPPTPAVSITAPQSNSQVSGTSTITASVQNPPASASVQFKVDNANLGSPVTITNGTASTPWNSTSTSNGAHMLSAALTDGSATSSTVMVMVSNPSNPTVSMTSPSSGATVSGTLSLAASCTNCPAGSSLQFKDGGSNIGGPAAVASGTANQQWNTVGVSNGTHSLTALLVGTSIVSSAVSVTVSNVSSVPPTCTFAGPSTVTVNSGATQQFTFSSTGTPTPTVDITAVLGVIVSVSGNTVQYRAPTTQANIIDTLDCHAHNGALPDGFDGVTINVTAAPPGAPQITGISPRAGYLRGQGALSLSLTGQNFAAGQTLTANHGNAFGIFLVNSTRIDFQWQGTISFFDPGEIEITLSDPKGSATTHFLFKGNFDQLVCSTTECFQTTIIPGVTSVYDRATGAFKRDISIGAQSIAWDNGSGKLVSVTLTNSIGVRTTNGGFVGPALPGNGQPSTEIAAKDGFACFARDNQGTLVCFDVRGSDPTDFIVSNSIGGKPTPIAMGILGSQLVVATFGVEDLKYSVLRVPQNTVLGQATLTGLRKASELDPVVGEGGWRLKLFSTGPASGIAALLHDEDKVVVFLNASTGAELRRATLTGVPFRMEIDETNGRVVVAKWDENERKTRFDRVNALTGQVTPVSGTVNFAATGMDVCGTSVCVANRDNAFAKVPLN